MTEQIKNYHLIFWKIVVIILGLISLSTGIIKGPGFWTSYALDITGPAWGYALIRVQYKSKNQTFFNIKFTPEIAFLLIVGICFIVESLQFFEIYDSTFDLFDFLAYFSGAFSIYVIDKVLLRLAKNNTQ